MSIKQPIYHEFDLNATSGYSKVISLTHTDDAHVDVIELCVKQQGAPVDIAGATVVARMVLHGTTDVLLNDSVPCTINSAGNILIPFDNAAIQSRKGIVKIEVNITRTPDIITLQLPLWVKINGSILDDATVDPHSEGTIPELLKDAADALEEATQALEQAGDYDSLEHKPQINGNTLSGNKTSDELGLQNKLTAGENVNIDANGNITITGVTKYRNVPAEQVDDCIENGVLYSLYISGLQSNAQIIAHNNYTTITQHALLDDGRLMYRMRQGETPWQPAGEWSAWEEIGGDYNSLSNKPQINSHTLSGNKSSDDLGLQKKLTAGTNITIENDGTISASGGVTSYNDLTDKPTVINSSSEQAQMSHTWGGTIRLFPFNSRVLNEDLYLTLDERRFFHSASALYSFDSFDYLNGRLSYSYAVPCTVTNPPPFMNAKNNKFVLYHFDASSGSNGVAQLVYWVDNTTNETKAAIRMSTNNQYSFASWKELTGGSQIVSGVVNQNGTITFTDSDGNTFTTTGSSVIGFSPTATVTQTQSGATVTITDKSGTTTANISNGADGQDYVLTPQDKTDIANIVLQLLPTTEGVEYGN